MAPPFVPLLALHLLQVGAVSRTWFEHVPPALPEGPVPLVLAFHGGGTRGDQMGAKMARFTELDALADREGFVVVYANGWKGHWSDGRGFAPAEQEGIDDLAFVDAILADVEGRLPIDTSRVYGVGVSNGGFFVQRLACERADRFAGVASVIATMAVPLRATCQPSRPVAQLFIVGTEDPLVPFAGGTVAKRRGECVSLADARDFWVQNNQCAAPATPDFPDPADDGTRTRDEHWGACSQDASVRALIVEGGGHTWPGGGQYLPRRWIGRASHDFEATPEIWSFLSKHHLPVEAAAEDD